MAIFKLIEEPDIVVAYIAIQAPFKNGEETNASKRLSLLKKVQQHIADEIKLANCEIEQEQMSKQKQLTIEDAIKEEENKM